MAAVWPDKVVGDNNLNVQVANLRHLLGAEAGHFETQAEVTRAIGACIAPQIERAFAPIMAPLG